MTREETMPLYDLVTECGETVPDRILPRYPEHITHLHIHEDGSLHLCPAHVTFTRPASTSLPCHPSETVVVWDHPVHGVRYPGRADSPMPPYYARMGFERREIRTLPDMNRFERTHGVANERMHYDRNGKADRDG